MRHYVLCSILLVAPMVAFSQTHAPLMVVADDGSESALPYYRRLNLLPDASAAPSRPLPPPGLGPVMIHTVSEDAMLPVRSTLLSPGPVPARTIRAPTLPPLFVVGDDPRSRQWLHVRGDTLRRLHAVGLVVNVASAAALTDLRQAAPGLVLAPSSGDDLARRLMLTHYPVLITATGIEQ